MAPAVELDAAAPALQPVRARGVAPWWAVAAGAFLVLSLVAGVLAGPLELDAGDVVRSALAKLGLIDSSPLGATEEAILWELRVPRVVLAALVGGMLAIAGATYQGVFHNPLADPYLLGVAAGAGLGATLAISYLPRALAGQQLLPLAAFVGGAAAVVVTWAIGRSAGRERDVTTFVLAGVVVASFFTARTDLRPAAELRHAAGGLLAGSSGPCPAPAGATSSCWLPTSSAATAVILVFRRVLDVLSLGDTEAAQPRRQRRADAPAARRRRDGRHRGGGRRQRPDRVRRDHRPAHHPAARGDELPRPAAALVRRRCGVPRRSPTSSREPRSHLPSCRSAS